MSRLRRCLPLLCLAVVCAYGWHTPPHQQMTRAALASLPERMRGALGPEAEALAAIYCMYPDRYRELERFGPQSRNNPGPTDRSEMRVYCETPNNKVIHNVTWDRADDVAAIEYLLNGFISRINAGDRTAAAKYLGTLAHLLEDSVSPSHSMDLRLVRDLLPPPPAKEKLNLHEAMEKTVPEFDLGGRAPASTGETVSEAAMSLRERCYTIVKDNRAHLVEFVRATYAEDYATMNRLKLRAARAGAELLADAYFTAFLLAEE